LSDKENEESYENLYGVGNVGICCVCKLTIHSTEKYLKKSRQEFDGVSVEGKYLYYHKNGVCDIGQ
jgi:hypothetical protein